MNTCLRKWRCWPALAGLLLTATEGVLWAAAVPLDCFPVSPVPAGPPGNPYEAAWGQPFLLKNWGPGWGPARFQQVYPSSDLAVCGTNYIYITGVAFQGAYGHGANWALTVQLDLSTTQVRSDTLSTNFVENLGPDNLTVYGPTGFSFLAIAGEWQFIIFDRPFRYNPALGKLLLDIRVFDGYGQMDPNDPAMEAQVSPNDGVASVFAPDVTATSGSISDGGLMTTFRLSARPSLVLRFESVFGTNRPVLRFSAQPSIFVLQKSAQLGASAKWENVTNAIIGSPGGPERGFYLPIQPPGTSGFYRLVWPGGTPASAAALPASPPTPTTNALQSTLKN